MCVKLFALEISANIEKCRDVQRLAKLARVLQYISPNRRTYPADPDKLFDISNRHHGPGRGHGLRAG